MRSKALIVCLCVVLAGCTGGPGTTTATTTESTTLTTTATMVQPSTTTESTPTTTPPTSSYMDDDRFDGDANTHVSVRNPTNETWNVTYQIERNGTVILNETRSVQPGDIWRITTLNQPGNYTFSASTEHWQDTLSTRLPRAVGDRKSWVEVSEVNTEFRLTIRWET